MERLPERMDVEMLFSEEEHYQLLNFIECATTLSKWIKILAISHTLEVISIDSTSGWFLTVVFFFPHSKQTDLYALATKTDSCLERIHPQGKLLTGPVLRIEFTKLVDAVKHLYEESCCLLHDRNDTKLKLREDLESKLSVTLANMELELRKCVMYDTPAGSLVSKIRQKKVRSKKYWENLCASVSRAPS